MNCPQKARHFLGTVQFSGGVFIGNLCFYVSEHLWFSGVEHKELFHHPLVAHAHGVSMQSCLTQQSLVDIVLHFTRLLLQIGKEPVVNFREFLSVLGNSSSTRNFMFTGRSHVRRIELVVRYLLSGSNERTSVNWLTSPATALAQRTSSSNESPIDTRNSEQMRMKRTVRSRTYI